MIWKFVVISRYLIYVRGSMQVFRHIDVVSNGDFDQMIELCLRFRAKVFSSPQFARRDEVNLKLREPIFLEFHCAFLLFSEAGARTPELACSKREPIFDKLGDARAGVLEPNERLMLDGAEPLPY